MSRVSRISNDRPDILVYGQLPPPAHGANIMTATFLRALADLGRPDALLPKAFSKRIEEVNRISWIKLARLGPNLLVYYRRLRRLRPRVLVFVLSSKPAGLVYDRLLLGLCRRLGIEYILYLHTGGYDDLARRSGSLRKIVGRIFRGARMSLVLGRTAADEAARISGRPVFVLPNCLDEDGRPGPAPPRVGTPFRILFLANLQESKGILTLLESAPAIVRARPEVRFRIAGPWQDNTLREKAFAFVRENGLEPFVEWLGPVAGRAKEELFLTSHLFVLPSRNETMSLAVLEAMRAALPVVTTDRGVLPEVVLDGRTGFIIPPADPGLLEARILALVDRPAEAAAMGKAGRDRFLAEYSYPAFRERVSSLLRETLGARP